jgi:hypothetical protein
MASIRAILKIYFVLILCSFAPLMAQSMAGVESVVPAVVKFSGVINARMDACVLGKTFLHEEN